MDKFVIRTPRDQVNDKQNGRPQKPRKKQTTIESLSRVVIVEQVHRQKEILKNAETTPQFLISTLKDLHKAIPSKSVLLETKVGHVVNKLRHHSDPEVKEQARLLLKKWKKFYREINARQPIDVRSDLKTEQFRTKARHLLGKAIGIKDDHALALSIEKTIYHAEKSVNTPKYRRLIRTICIKVTNDLQTKEQLNNGKLSTVSLIKMIESSVT